MSQFLWKFLTVFCTLQKTRGFSAGADNHKLLDTLYIFRHLTHDTFAKNLIYFQPFQKFAVPKSDYLHGITLIAPWWDLNETCQYCFWDSKPFPHFQVTSIINIFPSAVICFNAYLFHNNIKHSYVIIKNFWLDGKENLSQPGCVTKTDQNVPELSPV